jgi:hypothetical protein
MIKEKCVDGLMQEQKLSQNGFELFFLAQGSELAHFTRLRSTLSCVMGYKFTRSWDEKGRQGKQEFRESLFRNFLNL